MAASAWLSISSTQGGHSHLDLGLSVEVRVGKLLALWTPPVPPSAWVFSSIYFRGSRNCRSGDHLTSQRGLDDLELGDIAGRDVGIAQIPFVDDGGGRCWAHCERRSVRCKLIDRWIQMDES
jgi:hypothetical protein